MREHADENMILTLFTQAGFLLSIKAAVVLVLYVAILPFAQRTLTGSESSKSIRLARISVVSLAVGVAIIGISWNIPTLVPGKIGSPFQFTRTKDFHHRFNNICSGIRVSRARPFHDLLCCYSLQSPNPTPVLWTCDH